MNAEVKKLLFVAAGGFLVFYVWKKIKPIGSGSSKKSGKKSKSAQPTAEQLKNAAVAIRAYSNAEAAGESRELLDELNAEIAKDYSLRVYRDKTTGKLIATDLQGNVIS